MTKKEIVKQVASNLNMSQKDIQKVLEECLACMGDSLYKKESVILKDFGTFSIQRSKERSGRNPINGERIVIPAKDHVKFKPGSKILFYSSKV